MLEPKEVCTPRINRIEHYLFGKTLVHRILSTMPYVLCAIAMGCNGANHQKGGVHLMHGHGVTIGSMGPPCNSSSQGATCTWVDTVIGCVALILIQRVSFSPLSWVQSFARPKPFLLVCSG